MELLAEWLAPKYLDSRKLRAQYVKARPFPHATLAGFLREDKAKAVRAAIAREQWTQKESDLFKLSQTRELRGSNDPVLQNFRSLLASKEFSAWLTAATGVALTNKDLDMSGSLYSDTCFLLCHDDQVTGRKIAYIFYLCENFTATDGGALVLLGDKAGKPGRVSKRYKPQHNSLAIFTVSKKSWHAVEEVLSRKERVSINGWFH